MDVCQVHSPVYSSVAFRGSDTATRAFSFFAHISIILELQTKIKDSYNTGMFAEWRMLAHKNIDGH
jgi:hypothetical protein